jgi:DNA repair photolyase
LSANKHCPYSCAFCYVQKGGDFPSYANREISEIITYLQEHTKEYDIVYISGDTDSFAPPRTEKGLELLQALVNELDVDIQITTRFVFSSEQLQKIAAINQQLMSKGKKLIISISISRFYS